MSRISVAKLSDRLRTVTVDVLTTINKLLAIVPPSATPPTTRETGSPLQTGDNYINTTDGIQYTYKNGVWVPPTVAAAANLVGEVKLWTSATIPSGFVLCDGTVFNNTTYPIAASRLGATFGGNGSTTFAVPDMRGKFPIGSGSSLVVGQTGGSNTVTLTADQLPSHNHTATTTMAADGSIGGGVLFPSATAPYSYIGGTATGVQAAAGIFKASISTATQIAGLSTTIDNSVSAGNSVNVTNAYVALRYIICVVGV